MTNGELQKVPRLTAKASPVFHSWPAIATYRTLSYKRANDLVAQHEGPGRLAPHRLDHLRELVRSLAENITPADLDTLIDELGRLADELRQRRSQLTSSPHLTAAQA